MCKASSGISSNGEELIREVIQEELGTDGESVSGQVSKRKSYFLVLPVPPPLNKKFISRTFVVSKEYRQYKETVAGICMVERCKPLAGDIDIRINWYRARKDGDIDGRLKNLLDSLEGWCYVNDSQISDLSIKRSDDEPKNPRMIVEIRNY